MQGGGYVLIWKNRLNGFTFLCKHNSTSISVKYGPRANITLAEMKRLRVCSYCCDTQIGQKPK